MKYTYHPLYKTFFTKAVESTGRIHALIAKGKPWKNGFIERSNRTDNENLFQQIRFIDSQDRKYQLKLWEMEYNRAASASSVLIKELTIVHQLMFSKNNIPLLLILWE
jgi:hypothetical protein